MLPPLGLGASNAMIGSPAPMPLKEAPHRAATTSDPSLVHRHNDFVECQIRPPSFDRSRKHNYRDALLAQFRNQV
jgi:hypothetical protein